MDAARSVSVWALPRDRRRGLEAAGAEPRQLVDELLAEHLESASALEATLELVSERSNDSDLSLGGDETDRLGEEAIIAGATRESLQRREWCHWKRGRCIIRAACFTRTFAGVTAERTPRRT